MAHPGRSFYVFMFPIILACALLMCCGERSHPPPVGDKNYTISRRIEYAFSVTNKTNYLLAKKKVFIYAPVSRTPTQICSKIESSLPFDLIKDNLGNQILRFNIEKLPPFATKIIRVRADLRLSKEANPASLEDPDRYLQQGKYIESNNRKILKIARELKSAEPMQTAGNVYRWIVNHIRRAEYQNKGHGAVYALLHKEGDCTELMYLFIALCRANGIPARCIAGYVCTHDTVLKPQDYHNWAEFYLGSTWLISDPYNGMFAKNGSDYIAMRIFGAAEYDSRFRFDRFRCDSDTLRVVMDQ